MKDKPNGKDTGLQEVSNRIEALGSIGRSLSDKKRRQDSYNKRRMLSGELLPLLNEFIELVFSSEVANELKKIADPSVNLLQRIAEETSLLYRTPPQRRLIRQKDAYTKLITSMLPEGLDGVMRSAHRRLNGLGKIALRPVISPLTGRFEVYRHSPDNLVVLPDPRALSRPLAVAYRIADRLQNGDIVSRWVYFDKECWRILSDEFEDISETISWYDPAASANPYGAIPFVFLSLGEDEEDFWQSLSITDSLYRASLLIALNKTDKQHKMKWASFKQIAVKGEISGEMNDLYRDPAVLFQVEPTADIQVMDTESDFASYDAAINSNIADTACGYGLSLEDFKLTSQVQSGYSRLLQKEKLIDRNNLQKPIFISAENELFRLFARLSQIVKLPGIPAIDDNDTLILEFADLAYDSSNDTSKEEALIRIGAISPLDIIRKRNPGITDEKAEELLRSNLAVTQKYLSGIF